MKQDNVRASRKHEGLVKSVFRRLGLNNLLTREQQSSPFEAQRINMILPDLG
jgi:hypothetical protein